MKLSTHMIGQILATVLQILNLVSGQIPVKYQVYVAGLLAVLQALMGFIAHLSTPAGGTVENLQGAYNAEVAKNANVYVTGTTVVPVPVSVVK